MIRFDPTSADPFTLSRSKIELFLDCPRCFVLDRRYGISRPSPLPYTLQSTVDLLVKREFDHYRLDGRPHPLMVQFGIDGVPFRDPRLTEWRDMRSGVSLIHAPSRLRVFGAVDDIWQLAGGALAVVDYKTTSTSATLSIDDDRMRAYKRQLEIYQWLLRGQGLSVQNTGYLVYFNARRERPSFDLHLDFTSIILSYAGSDAWISDALLDVRRVLELDSLPQSSRDCVWCAYREAHRD